MKQSRLSRAIRSVPISKRIILMVMLVSVVPILADSFISYSQAYHAVETTAVDYNISLLDCIGQNIDLLTTTGNDFSNKLASASAVRDATIFYDKLTQQERSKAASSIHSLVKSQGPLLRYLYHISIITKDNEQIYSMSYLFAKDDAIDQDFEKIRDFDGNRLWFLSTISGRETIVQAQKIIHLGTLEVYGYILLYMDPSFLNILPADEQLNEGTRLTLLDRYDGTFSYCKDAAYDTQELETLQKIRTLQASRTVTRYSGDSENFVCYVSVPKLGWTLVSSMPYALLMRPIQGMRYTTIALAACLLLLCVVISKTIIGSISKPLNSMVRCINRASEHKFEAELVDDNADELGYLAQSYNAIFQRIRELVVQLEEEERSKRQAEIKMLQAQINPHFLFNTLDSLRFAAMMSNANSVSEGLSALSHLLRNSILRSDAHIPLEEEVQNIRDYLTIQKIRQGDSIRLVTQIEPDAQKGKIMKLLLQPIVENSVIHGMRDEEELQIIVSARVSSGMLCVTVADNGKGFTPAKNPPANLRECPPQLFGVGLDNVRQRLELEYKEQCSFTLESCIGKGTVVTITQPYMV